MADWHLWIIASLLLLVSEMFSGDFWVTCVAIGCLLAALVGLVTPFGLTIQVLAFVGGALTSLAFVRPALLRHFRIGQNVVRSNVDALPGKIGVVTERIGGPGRAGRALIEGEDWRVVAIDEAALESGTRIVVVQVDGSTLVVAKEE